MNRPLGLVLLGLALGLGACSSSDRSNRSGDLQTAAILIDTSRAGAYAVDARIDVLALERGDGSFTGNLLPASATVALARPSGTSAGASLSAIPPGAYVAVRLALAEGGVVATPADGPPETVVVPARDLRVPFPEPTEVASGERWLALECRQAPALQRDGEGRLTWQPDLTVRLGDVQPVHGAMLTVTAVEGDDVLGTLASCGGLHVRARFHADTVVTDERGMRERREAMRDARVNDEVECDGVVDHDGCLVLRRAHWHGRPANSAKGYGEIVELRPTVPAIVVQLREMVRGGRGIGYPLPALVVHTADARVYREGPRNVRLGFDAFAVGQRVEMDWLGTVTDGTIRARKIEIEDEGRARVCRESVGRVDAVDVLAGTMHVVPRGDDPLVVGGQPVPYATVAVATTTVIVREVGRSRGHATLADVAVGDRIWFWGRTVEAQKVEATAVRVRAAR